MDNAYVSSLIGSEVLALTYARHRILTGGDFHKLFQPQSIMSSVEHMPHALHLHPVVHLSAQSCGTLPTYYSESTRGCG